MDNIEANVCLAIEGQPVGDSSDGTTLCDFTLQQQSDAQAAKGPPNANQAQTTHFLPVLKSNVCYVVAGILFDEQGQVLMMQEAKSNCAGQWYLPAGRMEIGEDVSEAVAREVLEETGIIMEPTTLLMVESAGGAWFRFVLTGNVLGGKLKTPAEADCESLQAKWVGDLGELSLRANDILPVIRLGRQYHQATTNAAGMPASCWHAAVLAAPRAHSLLLLRLVVCVRRRSDNRLHVLVSEKTEAHLPCCEINPNRSLHSTLKRFMTEVFGADLPPHRPHGLLSVEHSGTPPEKDDGACFTLLVSVRKALEDVCLIDKYTWLQVAPHLADSLLRRLGKNMTVALNVIR